MPRQSASVRQLPRLPAALLRALLPDAEQDEVLADLAEEFAERRTARGAVAAHGWLWRQALASAMPLVRRASWRGWTGFDPRANRMRPGGPPMERWILDLRYAARRLRTRPTYTLLAVLTLALGVGGTAAIAGIVRGLLIQPLPYEQEAGVAVFWSRFSWNEQEFLLLRPEFEQAGFERVMAYRPEDVTLQLGDAPARILPGIAASSELFDVLGARPAIGRGFHANDDAPGAEPVAVLGHGLWRELGGDAGIVGRRIRLDGVERTVVGVMPRGFWFPDPTVRVWLPAQLDQRNQSGRYTFVGRLQPGRRADGMAPQLARITAILDEQYDYPAQWDKTRGAELTPVREYLVGPLRPALLATLAAMGVILLIACANVTALMLGQVDGRTAELAVRSALGADRHRLTRQLLVEALLLGALAGAAGAALASSAFRILVGALPLGAWGESATLDWTVFWSAMSIALVASLLIAVVPALALWRGDLRGALTRARTTGIGGRGGRMEGALVVAQVALAVLLASGAGMLIHSVANLYRIEPGVETRGIAVLDISMPASMAAPERLRVLDALSTELAALPGVRSAAVGQKLPLRGSGNNWGMAVEGRPDLPQSTTAYRVVSPGYLETMGIALRDGRTFEASDRTGGEPLVVVNQALADEYLPGVQPVGRRVATGYGGWARIIGVVATAAEASLTDTAVPARYMLYEQVPWTPQGHSLVLRTERPEQAEAVLDAARRTVQRLAPGVAVQEATTMERVLALAVGPARQVMTLLALLTALALVLGAVGVYGVISHFVHRRMRDWGIRLALGLTPAKVVAHVVGRGAALVAAGVVLGLLGVAVLARALASFLYGVRGTDPFALAAATGTLLVVGVLAAWLPAWRAGRVDPASVLREQ